MLEILAMQGARGEPIIDTIDSNGTLSWSDSVSGGVYRIEWASSLNDHWTDKPITSFLISTGTTSSIKIPMFYRIIRTDLTAEQAKEMLNLSISREPSVEAKAPHADISTLHSKGAHLATTYVGWLAPEPRLDALKDTHLAELNVDLNSLIDVHTNVEALGTIAFNAKVGSIIMNIDGVYFFYYAPTTDPLKQSMIVSFLITDIADAINVNFECGKIGADTYYMQIADIRLHFKSGRCVEDVTVDYQRGIITFSCNSVQYTFITHADSLADRILQTSITARDLLKCTKIEIMATKNEGVCLARNLLMFIDTSNKVDGSKPVECRAYVTKGELVGP